jgi:ubiquinone/menaquinone biosynthesis C-methylase UbiE
LRTIAQELHKPVEFQTSAGEHTPFPDSSFDFVLCCNVLDHMQEPGAVLKEVHRVLRPGGYFYLAVDVFSPAGLAKWKLWTRHRHKEEILVRAHPHRFLYGALAHLISQAGLQVKRREKQSAFDRVFGRSRRLAVLSQK